MRYACSENLGLPNNVIAVSVNSEQNHESGSAQFLWTNMPNSAVQSYFLFSWALSHVLAFMISVIPVSRNS